MDNISTTEEVVKTETPETEKFEVSKEEFEKLKELNNNKTIALKIEREEKAKTLWELEELRKFKQELEEKEKKKKGQYEELLTEKEELIKTLSEKAKQFDEYMTTLQETKTKEFENVIKDIPDNLKEKYSKITDKLVLEDKIEFYKNLATDIKKEDFSNQPWNNGADIKNEWLEKAKAQGFDSFMTALIQGQQ